jgi:flagellar hook-associated protein 1 FlgK
LGGNNANDLRDRRDLAVEKLSNLTNLEVEETETGLLLTVGGDTLVDGLDYFLLEAVDDGAGHLTVEFEGGGALFFDAGRFQGYRNSYQLIDETLDTINDLTAVLIEEVNAIHNTGFDLLGGLGDDFFEGTDATNIQVNSNIVADARLVAGSGSGAPGNGDTALEIAQLAMSKIAPGGDAQYSLNEYFGNLVVNLGSRARQASQRTDDYSASLEFVMDQRRFISGVNMDEEVSNLLAFQHGYAAASRVITAVDDMMDRVINRTGRVGL